MHKMLLLIHHLNNVSDDLFQSVSRAHAAQPAGGFPLGSTRGLWHPEASEAEKAGAVGRPWHQTMHGGVQTNTKRSEKQIQHGWWLPRVYVHHGGSGTTSRSPYLRKSGSGCWKGAWPKGKGWQKRQERWEAQQGCQKKEGSPQKGQSHRSGQV